MCVQCIILLLQTNSDPLKGKMGEIQCEISKGGAQELHTKHKKTQREERKGEKEEDSKSQALGQQVSV